MIKSPLPFTPAKSLAIVFLTCLFIATPAVSQNIEQQIGFYQHASGEYLNKIGNQLVTNLDQPSYIRQDRSDPGSSPWSMPQ